MYAPRRAVAFLSLACISSLCYAADLTFQRSLTASGNVAFSVCNDSGSIHVAGADGSKIEIAAKIHPANWHDFGNSDTMKKIAAAPPVQQTGNAVHVGNSDICGGSAYQNIDIDYEITVPKGSTVVATSGSGDIHVESIGGYVRAHTGKGNILANGIGSDSFLRTGSGTIDIQSAHGIMAAETGTGDVSLRGSDVSQGILKSGSGNITTLNLRGGLRADTGSGTLTIGGTPTADWKLGTGSGAIHLHVDPAAKFNLDAEAGSGSIDSKLPAPLSGHIANGVLKGPVNGGGPLVELYTGSGSIDVD